MKTLLCAIVKNENRYLAEWVEYYRKLEFDKIILYDNNDPDGEAIPDFGDFVEVIDYRGKHVSLSKEESVNSHGVQEEAYNDCYLNRAKGFDWVAFFDIDEYLVLDNYNTIWEFLMHDQLFYDDDAIQINWQTYGDNNLVRYEDKPLQERFTKPSAYQTEHVKTIVKTANPDFISMRCHWADIKNGRIVYPNGMSTIPGPKQPINYEGARIIHYFTKTIDEWIDRKFNATSATGKDFLNDHKRRINEFFQYNEMTSEKVIFIGEKLGIEIDKSKRVLPVIVSLTSYGERFKNLPIVLRSIFKNTVLPRKVVITVYKDDLKDIPESVMELIKKHSDFIELYGYYKNLKPHLKYFFTMLKYRHEPIITIDDDVVYSTDLIESLYREHLWNPDCVICRRAHRIVYTQDGKWESYDKWKKDIKEYVTGKDIFATGVGGVLYPANALNVSDYDIPYMEKFLLTDDLYLKHVEDRKNIQVVHIKNKHSHGLIPINDYESMKKRLYDINVVNHNNDVMIDEINNDYNLNIYYDYEN